MAVSYDLLKQSDDRTTEAIISLLRSDPRFGTASSAATISIQERDRLDDEKLAKGIALSVQRGVLQANPPVEEVTRVSVTGKTADQVSDEIISKCGRIEEGMGRVIILTGLSGTGKGTTAAKLASKLPRSMTWSNGNMFRCLTALAEASRESAGVPLTPEFLSESNVANWIKCISFTRHPTTNAYDLRVEGNGLGFFASEAANTTLKAPAVAKALPFVAEYTQGDVVKAAGAALDVLQKDGYNVLVEGRAQTLDHIRSPYRFELVLDDVNTIGERQVALRCMSLAKMKSVLMLLWCGKVWGTPQGVGEVTYRGKVDGCVRSLVVLNVSSSASLLSNVCSSPSLQAVRPCSHR